MSKLTDLLLSVSLHPRMDRDDSNQGVRYLQKLYILMRELLIQEPLGMLDSSYGLTVLFDPWIHLFLNV